MLIYNDMKTGHMVNFDSKQHNACEVEQILCTFSIVILINYMKIL